MCFIYVALVIVEDFVKGNVSLLITNDVINFWISVNAEFDNRFKNFRKR